MSLFEKGPAKGGVAPGYSLNREGRTVNQLIAILLEAQDLGFGDVPIRQGTPYSTLVEGVILEDTRYLPGSKRERRVRLR